MIVSVQVCIENFRHYTRRIIPYHRLLRPHNCVPHAKVFGNYWYHHLPPVSVYCYMYNHVYLYVYESIHTSAYYMCSFVPRPHIRKIGRGLGMRLSGV